MSRSRRWRKDTAGRKEARALASKTLTKMETEKKDYGSWSNEELIARVTQLEAELKTKNASVPTTIRTQNNTPTSTAKHRQQRVFNPEKYNTRFVAFKLAYLGKRYNGFEYTQMKTPLPTIEEELWKALNRARLIFPEGAPNPMDPGEINWEGMDYSKCGRTDKGVSAFGQVIALRVRSNRPMAKKRKTDLEAFASSEPEAVTAAVEYNTLPRNGGVEIASPPLDSVRFALDDLAPGDDYLDHEESDYDDALNFDPVLDELNYCQLLNRQLPPDIRILAWLPAPPIGFSARFSCQERQYKYYFTQPAFTPTPDHLEIKSQDPTQIKDGWLDIDAMRDAAKLYEGLHDFRNFCKIDGGKQIFDYHRRVFYSNIEECQDEASALPYLNEPHFVPKSPTAVKEAPKVYTFSLNGSAFLWHQVRHMVAILFLVGQGLEKPSIVTELLDVKKNPGRPVYEMASDTPLVLWDCVFPRKDDEERKDILDWHYVGDGPQDGDSKYGTSGLMDSLWQTWRERKIDETLAATLLNLASKQGDAVDKLRLGKGAKTTRSQKVFDGDNTSRGQGRYIPVMQKRMMDTVEAINLKYAVKKGFETSDAMKLAGYRTMKKMGPPKPPVEGEENSTTGRTAYSAAAVAARNCMI